MNLGVRLTDSCDDFEPRIIEVRQKGRLLQASPLPPAQRCLALRQGTVERAMCSRRSLPGCGEGCLRSYPNNKPHSRAKRTAARRLGTPSFMFMRWKRELIELWLTFKLAAMRLLECPRS